MKRPPTLVGGRFACPFAQKQPDVMAIPRREARDAHEIGPRRDDEALIAENMVVKGVLYLGVRGNPNNRAWQNYAGHMARVGNIDGNCLTGRTRPWPGPGLTKGETGGEGRKIDRPAEAGRGSE